MSRRTELRQLITAMVIFGTIGILTRYIPYSSAVIAFGRGIIGALALGLLLAWQRPHPRSNPHWFCLCFIFF